MARSRSRNRRNRRDHYTPIANRRLPAYERSFATRPVPYGHTKSILSGGTQDGRTWHPSGYGRPPAQLAKIPKITVSGINYNRTPQVFRPNYKPLYKQADYPGQGVAFTAPRRMLVCVRRKIRKEVLHALRKTGRGGGRQRPPRFNEFSDISCK